MKVPTLYGLMQAQESAQALLQATDKKDADAYASAKEALRKAKENLRVYAYRQKSHLTPKGTVLRV